MPSPIIFSRRTKLGITAPGGGGGSYVAEVTADAPVAWYRLDETSGTTLVSAVAGVPDGTYQFSPSVNQAGAGLGTGKSVDFTFGYGSLGSPSALHIGSPITLEGWVYRTGSIGEGNCIICEAYQGDNTVKFVLGRHASGWGYGHYNGGWAGVTVADPPLNTWSHEVSTSDASGNVRFYRNGVLISGPTAVGVCPPGNESFFIARRWDQNTFFPGRIDEVAVYNKVLSAARILAHYQAKDI